MVAWGSKAGKVFQLVGLDLTYLHSILLLGSSNFPLLSLVLELYLREALVSWLKAATCWRLGFSGEVIQCGGNRT